MSENGEEPSQERQRFANLESEDLNSLLDTAKHKVQSIIQYTLYLFTKVRYFNFTLSLKKTFQCYFVNLERFHYLNVY